MLFVNRIQIFPFSHCKRLQLHFYFPMCRRIPIIPDPRRIQHSLGRNDTWRFVIFIICINQRFNSCLYNCLGTLVAGEKRHIHLCSLQASSPVVQYRIQFTVSRVEIFFIQLVSLSRPGNSSSEQPIGNRYSPLTVPCYPR